MAITTNDIIADLDKAKPIVALLPAPSNAMALAGIEIAELVLTFVEEGQRQAAFDQIRAFLRAGAQGAVQAALNAEFPEG